MTKVLIPRSDSISAKIIEPSDFEEFFSFVGDYIITGFTPSAGSGLAVNISTGKARLKGLFVESTAQETVSSLTQSTTNYIWITIARDSSSEAESWSFTKTTSSTVPTDSILVAKATTDGSGVTAVDVTTRPVTPAFRIPDVYGDGSDSSATISSNSTINSEKNYTALTVNSGVTLSFNGSNGDIMLIRVDGTLTLNGTISNNEKGQAGGAGATSPQNNWSIPGFDGVQGTNGVGAFGITQTGAAGGKGGDTGGKDGGVATDAVVYVRPSYPDVMFNPNDLHRSFPQVMGAGGGGGASGAAEDVNTLAGGNGGAGGRGGGTVIIFARTITIGSGGKVEAKGQNGVNGAQAAANSGNGAGGGGGGGAGGGGAVVLVYESLTNNGTIDVAGGTGGTGGSGRHSTGQAGANGSNGGAGVSKLVADTRL